MSAISTSADILDTRTHASDLWLRSRTWDLTFISLSAALVALPFAAYEILIRLAGVDADLSRNIVNGIIALTIGGPHMYATYSRTFLDGEFRRRHIPFLAGSLLLPVGVVYFGVFHFQYLITFFFFWASVHVLHQIAYIIDCYNQKNPRRPSLGGRLLDYVVVMSSLYPLAVWRMVHGDFRIGQIELLFPSFLRVENSRFLGWGLFVLASAVFGVSLLLWLARTWQDHLARRLHAPKVLLMGLTIGISFFIPAYHELDVAFQGMNTWHSFQYLGLTLYINQLRQRGGKIHTPFVREMSREGKGWRFYLFNVGCSVGAVVVIGFLLLLSHRGAIGLSFDQCYYVVVLSFLLMHYYHDHLLFTETGALTAS